MVIGSPVRHLPLPYRSVSRHPDPASDSRIATGYRQPLVFSLVTQGIRYVFLRNIK